MVPIRCERDAGSTPWSRRQALQGLLAVAAGIPIAAFGQASTTARRAEAADALTLPPEALVTRFDFENGSLDGWQPVDGRWAIEEMSEAPSGKRVLVQHATGNAFNVIVAPGGPYTDAEITVRFKPLSGQEDASGGIVFRFAQGRYYVVRANALEGNFRLYYYDRGRHEIASAAVPAPALGHWHTLRLVVVGDRVQASLNDRLLLDHRDTRFRMGQVGLWTKADSVTAFDDLTVRGIVEHG